MDNNKPNPASDSKSSAQPPAPVEPASKPTEPATKARGPGWLLWILVIVLVIAGAAFSAYLWNQNLAASRDLQVDVSAALARVEDQAAANRELQRSVDAQASAAAQQISELQQQLNAQKSELESQRQKLLNLSTTDRSDWLLAEIEYLMRLANQRLLLSRDTGGAAQLLQAADEILRELDDSALYPVRRALASEVAALKAAGHIDIEGIYLKIDALAAQADNLRLFDRPRLQEPATTVNTNADWQQKLQSGLANAWNKLKGYIQIRRNDDIYQPLLAPEHEQLLRQSLHLQFEQAQSALLAGNQALYSASLNKARDWLKQYYQLDSDGVAATTGAIDHLLTQPMTLQAPDISRSLRALKDYMATLHTFSPAKAKPAVSPEPAAARVEKAESTGASL